MEAPEAYLRRYVEDAFEGRTPLAGFFSILLWRTAIFGSNSVSHQRRRIDLLQREIVMPNKLPLEPLACHPLISKLDANLVQVPFHLFHSPFAQPGGQIALPHGTHMFGHRLKYCGIADGPIVLY